jgi:glycyl-tRNA synthetase beta subunit
LRTQLLDEGHAYDVVDAVLATQGHDPYRAAVAVKALGDQTQRKDWSTVLDSYARCVRITRDQKIGYTVDAGILVEKSEKALLIALEKVESMDRASGSVMDFFAAFEPLVPAITAFFDDVLVMAEDAKLREARLGLLQRVAALVDGVADLSKLEGF